MWAASTVGGGWGPGAEAAVGAGLGASVDRRPHPGSRRRRQASREHLRQPLCLALDDFQTARASVDDADEREAVGVGREDAPVEREPLSIAATEGLGQEREVDPVARGEDDRV